MRRRSVLTLAAVAALTLPAIAQEAPKERPAILVKPIRQGLTYEAYIQDVMRFPRQAFGAKGYIDKSDIEARQRKARFAMTTAATVMVALFDRNGDGAVTADEIRETVKDSGGDGSGMNAVPGGMGLFGGLGNAERAVTEVMKADANGDGKVDRTEMATFMQFRVGPGIARDRETEQLGEYLALAPDGKLTARKLLDMARETFDVADADHDTVISDEEARPYMPARNVRPPMPERPAECSLPKLIPGSKLVLYGTNSGSRQATVSLAGDVGEATNVADVVVEPGDEPLYVVLTSYNSMLWRFSGDTNRVVKVVATAIRRADNSGAGLGGSGVTGVPKERVAFLPSVRCLPYFTKLDTIEEARTRGTLAEMVGVQPDYKGAVGVTDSVSIPSMKAKEPQRSAPWDGLPVIDVKPEEVVAVVPVKRFDVMPGKAGLDQLLERGNIVRLAGDSYKIVRTFPRFPTGLTGGIQPKFLLGTGVEMPGGSSGWACVVSEETGKILSQNQMMCR